MKNYRILGISSGIGVSLFPALSLPQAKILGNVELRPIFRSKGDLQWKSNFGNIPLFNDLPNIKKQVHVIISSPDCGSGSVFRLSRAKKLGNHKFNKSLSLFIDGVNKYQPYFFYFENLPGLYKTFPKAELKEQLPNYKFLQFIESVSAWGNSQVSRKRLVIIGVRKDLPKWVRKSFSLPKIESLLTCWELYGDLGKEENIKIGHVREPETEVISIYGKKKMSLKAIRKEWKTRLANKKRWIVESGNFKTAPGVYRNLDHEYPATARKSNRQYDQHGRQLTPRQLARIQGVPDSFVIYFPEKPENHKYWINKGRAAVTKTPPYEIGEWFLKSIQTIWNQMTN